MGVTCFGYFFGRIFFLSIFSAVREISRTFEILTPPPGRWTPRGGVGKNLFYWFSGHSWVWLIEGSENDVITSTDSLWRHLPHNGSQKKLAAKSRFGYWSQWPHASRPFMGPIFGRNHSQVYPHICVPNLVMIGPAVWPPILDRQTHTHTEFVLYRYRYHYNMNIYHDIIFFIFNFISRHFHFRRHRKTADALRLPLQFYFLYFILLCTDIPIFIYLTPKIVDLLPGLTPRLHFFIVAASFG